MAADDGRSIDQLLDLVKRVCTKDQIQRLLREAKQIGEDGNTIRITGKIDTIVSQHLRDAVQLGRIDDEAIRRLIGESEESGRQHIFYFRPKDERVIQACNDAERVAFRLLGPRWREDRGFPRFYLNPMGFEWTDFRSSPSDRDSHGGWTAKAYAGIFREKHVDTKEEGPNRIVKIYERVLSREIYLVRWHAWGLLELRVPLERTSKALFASVRALWTSIESAVSSDDFEPFDLTNPCRRMLARYAEHGDDYRLGDAHLLDSEGGTARLSPRAPEDHLMNVEARRRAVELFDRCRMLVVVWLLKEERHDAGGELRTVIGKLRSNEVVILSRTTAKAVDHVTRRLCRFEGQPS